jgi:hypothetical protein
VTIIQDVLKNVMKVLDYKGDTFHEWNPSDPDETAAVKATFDSLKKKGYLAYTVTDGNMKGEVIHEFDPQAGKIVMNRQPVGG